MYDLTRLRYSVWSIFVLAYPTILMSLGRNLLRNYYRQSGQREKWIMPHTKPKSAGNVFFFARSPEAPKTTMIVFSLSSMFLSPVWISMLTAI